MMSQKTFEKLTALLDSAKARYRIIRHSPAGKSEEVAKIRGTQIGQGAKALVCVVKGNEWKQYVLAVLPADQQADLGLIATALGDNRAALVSPVEVEKLTDCVFGAIPPFSFHEDLLLIAEPALFERYDELAFNAGILECSLILNAKDYHKTAKPKLISFKKQMQ